MILMLEGPPSSQGGGKPVQKIIGFASSPKWIWQLK
jgi:hypothetical protein